MTKVVTYLFDNMFQGKQPVSLNEKVIVILVAGAIICSTVALLI